MSKDMIGEADEVWDKVHRAIMQRLAEPEGWSIVPAGYSFTPPSLPGVPRWEKTSSVEELWEGCKEEVRAEWAEEKTRMAEELMEYRALRKAVENYVGLHEFVPDSDDLCVKCVSPESFWFHRGLEGFIDEYSTD